jgi:hypothetical protein
MRVCKIFLPFGDDLDVNMWSVGSPIYGVLAHICDSIAKICDELVIVWLILVRFM